MIAARNSAWLAALLLPLGPALAAGGAHVVDDSEIEAPGTCQLEAAITGLRGGRLLQATPACVLPAGPPLEIGLVMAHERVGGAGRWSVGPELKLVVRDIGRGPGVAIVATVARALASPAETSAALLVPVSFDLGSATRLNVNAGWAYTARPATHEAVYGAQVEQAIGRHAQLMAEVWGADRRLAGVQAGLRLQPRGDRFDIDLLLARSREESRPLTAATIGLNVRFEAWRGTGA